MKSIKLVLPKLLFATLTAWGIFVVIVLLPMLHTSFTLAIIPLIVFTAMVLSFLTVIQLIRGKSSLDARDERLTSSPAAKVLSILIIIGLVFSSYAAIKSFWIDPSHTKFAYENLSAITSFVSLVFICILSALQKDIYWLGRKKTIGMDERQIKDRVDVFEKSYKIGTALVLLTVFATVRYIHNVPEIIVRHNGTLPGHFTWLVLNLVFTFAALPLIIAVLRKK